VADDWSPIYGPNRGVPECSEALNALSDCSGILRSLKVRDMAEGAMTEVQRSIYDAVVEARKEAFVFIEQARDSIFALIRLVAR